MEELNKIFTKYIEDERFPGIQWQINLKDEIYSGKVGYNNIETKEPILDNKRYIAPELHKIFSLPHKTNIRCIYYTIALLVKDAMKINEPLSISNIANSSLYYFLERCMIKEPSLRKYLFI